MPSSTSSSDYRIEARQNPSTLTVPNEYELRDSDSSSISNHPDTFSAVLEDDSNPEPFSDEQLQHSYIKHSIHSVSKQDEHFNQLLCAFITDYTARSKSKRNLKIYFFWVITSLLLIIMLSPLIIIFLLLYWKKFDILLASVTLLGTVIEVIPLFMTLPKLLATYLFNPKEDENFMELIKNMQEYNTRGHDRLNH